ncbi:MAG: TIGR04133 family radical SAM/SPASM protein [Bacteroidales bacterium]|nr:TIGR04133 family radical SAM/SPASM protein [Bacteroidales bacterium]
MINLIKKKVFQQIKKAEIKQHELNYLFWECTTRCNLNCLHCGSDCSKNSAFNDMPLNDFLKALDTIKNPSSNFTVVLTGGEPLLRKDIEQCGRAIRQRGMKWSMVSNGHFYTAEKHNTLLNAGMGALTISLDGLEKSHNWLRNNDASFSKVEKAIALAASSKRLNFDVVTCVNKINLSELQSVYDFLLERGVKAWRLFTIIPIGRASENPNLLLADNEFKQLMDFIALKRKGEKMEINFSCEGYVGDYELKVRDSYFFCRAGINIGSILIDGSIMACPNIDRSFSQGNIYQDNFFEIWQTKYHAFRDRSWTKKGECASCADYKDCQGNGFHNWHGTLENVLVCHNKKIQHANNG